MLLVDLPAHLDGVAGGVGHQPTRHLLSLLLSSLRVPGTESLGQENHLQQLRAPLRSPGSEAVPDMLSVTLLAGVGLLVGGADISAPLLAHLLVPHTTVITALLSDPQPSAVTRGQEDQQDLQWRLSAEG